MGKWQVMLASIALTSCTGQYLTVHQERIDREFLASTYVGTPDPRQKDPPTGQRLILSWDFPLSLYREKLSLFVTVRFWDNTEESQVLPLRRKRGIKTFFFENKRDLQSKKILTYFVEAKNKNNETVAVWQHQLWCKLISPGE